MSKFLVENKQITSCYCCVIHNRLISARVTPTNYPVRKFAVVFCGIVQNNVLECKDDGEKLIIKITPSKLILKIDKFENQISYEKDKMATFHIDICDAIESWEFYISDSEIDCEKLKPGYRKIGELYYNIEDEEENEQRRAWLY